MSLSKEQIRHILKDFATTSTLDSAIKAISSNQLFAELLYTNIREMRANPDVSMHTVHLMDELANELSHNLMKYVCVLIATNIIDPLTAARLLMELTVEGEDRQLMYDTLVEPEYSFYFGIKTVATILNEYDIHDEEYIKDISAVDQFYPLEATYPDQEEQNELNDEEN